MVKITGHQDVGALAHHLNTVFSDESSRPSYDEEWRPDSRPQLQRRMALHFRNESSPC